MTKQWKSWMAVAAPLVLMAVASTAEAAVTCEIVPSMCTPAPQAPTTSASVSVPEPTTLLLMATGFGGAGLAAWRRRNNKKK